LSQALVRMEEFTPQKIENALWAMAVINAVPEREVLAGFAVQATETMRHFEPPNLVNIFWSFAIFNIHPERSMAPGLQGKPFIDALFARTAVVMDKFETQQLSLTCWSITRLRLQASAGAIAAISKRAVQLAPY
jgi:hypothetical protein